MKRLIILIGILTALSSSVFAVSTTDLNSTTALALAQSIVGNGISISNVKYTGTNVAGGTFTGGLADGLGIDSGVILCTGNVASAKGPNSTIKQSTDNGTAGDADLNVIVGSSHTTFDAAVLEFDFVPTQSTVSFSYVFASEEYNEFVFAFNDVFAFYIDGQNVALIPGTTTPVSINTVNLQTNAEDFHNNDPATFGIPTPFGTAYDGFTVVFSAGANLTANATHHIKLAIADTDDGLLDSAVFIEAGSFTTCNTPDAATGPQIYPTANSSNPVTASDYLTYTWQAPSSGTSPAGYHYAINSDAPQDSSSTEVDFVDPLGVRTDVPITLKVTAFACSPEVDSTEADSPTYSLAPPVASISASPTTIAAGQSVTFDDTASTDGTAFVWFYGDATECTCSEQNVTHTFDQPGIYPVYLVLSNGSGSSVSPPATIVVTAAAASAPAAQALRSLPFLPGNGDTPTGGKPGMVTRVPDSSSQRWGINGMILSEAERFWMTIEPATDTIAYIRFERSGQLMAERRLDLKGGHPTRLDLGAYPGFDHDSPVDVRLVAGIPVRARLEEVQQ